MGSAGRKRHVESTKQELTLLHFKLYTLGYIAGQSSQAADSLVAEVLTALQQFQADHQLSPTGMADDETLKALADALKDAAYSVSGTVKGSDPAQTLGGLNVELLDQNVGGSEVLATTTTLPNGSFVFGNLVVPLKTLANKGKRSPDLQVRASGSAGMLAVSPVHYEAPRTVTFALTLPRYAKGLASEYEALAAAVKQVYSGDLADLQENDERQDVAYLSEKIGSDRSAVAALAAAHQQTQPDGAATAVSIDPAFLFALFRAGVVADDRSSLTSPSDAETIWQDALQNNIIPSALANDLPGTLAAFAERGATQWLQTKPGSGASTPAEMLQCTLPDAGKQAQFTTLYTGHTGAPEELWTKVAGSFGEDVARQLQLDGQLFHLTRNNAPLVSALKSASSQPLTQLRDLAANGYDTAAGWLALMTGDGDVPASIKGATATEQRNNYAELLASHVRAAFPTDVLAAQIKRGMLPMVGGSKSAEAVHAFLSEHGAEFNFGKEPVETYLRRKNITGTPSRVVEEVKRLHRVHQMTPDDQSMAVLLHQNLDSASTIVRYDSAEFQRAFADKLGSTDKAKLIHTRAKQVYNTVLNTTVTYLAARAQPSVGSLSGSTGTARGFIQALAANPSDAAAAPSATLESLFGSLDYCGCSDCNSILSPAAYLVDLLNFLDKQVPTAGLSNPLQILFSRRPDLQYLPLTCENTNTALPYIDLVNETLEAFVANGLSLQGYQGHDTGDTYSSADLLSSPQFVNAAAYGVLENAYFPAPLPFDRSLELLRAQFASLGLSLPNLMIALRVNDSWLNDQYNGYLPISYGWADISLELLQISWDELNVFTGVDTDVPDIDLGSLYGLPSDGTALATLQGMNLQAFTRRLGISYDDIDAIVQTRWINPDAKLIPLLQQLQVPITTLAELEATTLSADTFKNLLPAGIDATKYGGTSPTDLDAIVTWVTGPGVAPLKPVYPRLMDIVTIADPNYASACTGTSLSLRYTNPDSSANLLTQTDYIRISRFVRLWQKLASLFGTTDNTTGIQQTANIIDALYPADCQPQNWTDPANDEQNYDQIAEGFAEMLPSISFLWQIMGMLSLTAEDALPQLLACWAPIQTVGPNSLYEQLFLTPSQLQQDQMGQTATVSGYFDPGQKLTVTINGVALSYIVKFGDQDSAIAAALVNAINTCDTKVDPDTGMPLNRRFYASADGGVITIRVGFYAQPSVSNGATETLQADATATNTPLMQTLTLGGTVTAGDVLTILINDVPVSITAQANDTLNTVVSRFVDAFSTATMQDAFSGQPLNTVVLAAEENGLLLLTAANNGVPFDLVCSLSEASIGGVTVGPQDSGGELPITFGGAAVVGDSVAFVFTLPAAAAQTFTYVAVAADSQTGSLAQDVAAFLQQQLPGSNYASMTVSCSGDVVTVNPNGSLGLSITSSLTLLTGSTVTVAVGAPVSPSVPLTILPGNPATAVISLEFYFPRLSRTFRYTRLYQYTVQPNETPESIAAAMASGISAAFGPTGMTATSQGAIVQIFLISTRYYSVEITPTVSMLGGYVAGQLSPANYQASLIGSVGMQIFTTINGIAIPHTVTSGEAELEFGPGLGDLCASINNCTALDPLSLLPINQIVSATPDATLPYEFIVVVPVDPRTGFTMSCSYIPVGGEDGFLSSYTLISGPNNASQSITVSEPISPKTQLVTTINGTDIFYTVTAEDTAVSIATNIAAAINSSQALDPASGEPLSTLFSASVWGSTIGISSKLFTTPLVLSVSSTIGTLTAGKQQTPFADDGYGNLLSDSTQTVIGYEPLLCAACNLTGAEFALIITALNFDSTTLLTLENVSSIFRFGWLPHNLGISVLEFLQLRACSQLDPFQPLFMQEEPQPVPPAVRFISLVQTIAAAGLKPVQALYLMWNNDLTGTAAPTAGQIYALAFALRQDFVAVNTQFAIVSDPDGSIAASLMALVYGTATTDFFFGLLNNTVTPTVAYAAPPDQSTLPDALVTLSNGQLQYDDLRKQLSYAGLLDSAMKAKLLASPVLISTTDATVDAPAGPATVFTPASMANITVGSQAWIDSGTNHELVTVAAATTTTFTAATRFAHNGTTTPVAIIDPLFVAIGALFIASNALANPFFAQYPELLPLYTSYAASSDPVQDKRTTLLANFVPTLRTERKQEQALARITAAVGTDATFATALLTDPLVIHADGDISSPAIVDLTAIEDGGLSLPPDATGTTGTLWAGALDVPQNGFYNFSIALDAENTVSVSINSAVIAGGAAGGLWTSQSPVSLVAGSPVSLQLTFSEAVGAVTLSWQSTGTGWQPVPSTYLYPANLLAALQGTYVRFLKAASLASALSLTANEIASLGRAGDPEIQTTSSAKVVAGPVTLSPVSMQGIALGSLLVLDSGDEQEIVTVTAVTSTKFSAITVRPHNGSVTPFTISSLTLVGATTPETSGGWLNLLGPLGTTQPDAGTPPAQVLSPATQTALRDILQGLMNFARMKQSLSPGDERLLQVIQNPASTLPNGQPALVGLTGWIVPSINALLQQFFGSIQPAGLATVENFRRVFDAYALVQQCRISAAALIAATTTVPTANTVSALQSALRAQYAEADWQTVIQPINDAMRIKQRDALVAYILQQPFAALNNINTADDLFAYFLLDTETQPPVQSSRIRLALSSVQLFTERCARSLEPFVAAADIDATQWTWMKRYRVWQANRELFLWPENWLYPELRDDASPFFTSTMSSLLQSDITDDAATNAYLDYLTNLEEVAKLEPCGMYYIPGSIDSDETTYVVSRTSGGRCKYYFRQLTGGSWTAWTEVPIECEGLPLTPVIWNGRLFLFWLKAVKQQAAPAPFPQTPTNNDVFSNLTTQKSQQNAQDNINLQTLGASLTIGGVLCWTEFYNNKWQPTKTSDVNRPTLIGQYSPAGPNSFEFQREQLHLIPALFGQNATANGVTEDLSQALLISIETGNTAYNSVGSFNTANPSAPGNGRGFLMHNTHSRPIRFEDVYLQGHPIRSLLDWPLLCRIFWPQSDYSGAASNTVLIMDFLQSQDATGNPALSYGTNPLWFTWAPAMTQPPAPANDSSGWTAPFFYEDRKNLYYSTVSFITNYQPQAQFGLAVRSNRTKALPKLATDPRFTAAPANEQLAGGTSAGSISFHRAAPADILPIDPMPGDIVITLGFQNFFHPYVGALIQQLNQGSIASMLNPDTLAGMSASATGYAPWNGEIEPGLYNVTQIPKLNIDVSIGGPYANYNWELLYHIPVMIAVHLSNNQRFTEAQKWFHLVFDPTAPGVSSSPTQAWRSFVFQDEGAILNITTLLELLSQPAAPGSADATLKSALLNGYNGILSNPFQPFVVARTRPSAFQWYVVMKYLDNLIAWGDSLFLQNTIETINEATLCYVLAANLLGPTPQQMPNIGTQAAKSYLQLQQAGFDRLGDALVNLEAQFPFDVLPTTTAAATGAPDLSGPLFGIGQSLYFCVPPNPNLLTYWDTVSDRLFKIRNGENISGTAQQLPLFDPPLDPGLLVKAAAAGLDIGSIVSGLNQPLGPVRTPLLMQKAMEIAAEVRSLGAALLAALEKVDTEQLALLRQGHEIQLQQMTQNVRFLQWQHAQETTNGLLKTRDAALERYTYYLRLLNQTPDPTTVPPVLGLNRVELTEDNFDDTYAALVTAYSQTITPEAYNSLQLAGGNSPSNQAGASGQGQLYLNQSEDVELNDHLPKARDTRMAANVANTIAGALMPIPSVEAHLAFWGIGIHSVITSGQMLSGVAKIAADVLGVVAGYQQDQAGIASRKASYQRRTEDWTLQANLAARDLMQIGQQILASLLAEQVSSHEYQTVKTQVQQAKDIQSFLQDKTTSAAFYGWMQSELSGLYYQYYRFACDTARRAEATMKQELMRPELDATEYIQFNYWDSGHQGLLSGEALSLDLKRMEMDYYTNNKRELEITRHISLRQLDASALLSLKITGSCTITVPEWLFDRDCPGHYLRRVKSIGVSLPAVVGPYTGLNCTLTLQSSSIRTSPLLSGNDYARSTTDADDRFTDYFGSTDMVVTSTGNNDSGMFETNLRDDRFLPFEGAGAISTWKLSLPPQPRSFDSLTISDAILHMRYTARSAGDPLAGAATANVLASLAPSGQAPQLLLFCLLYDFPTEWAAFLSGTSGFSVTLQQAYFPYAVQSAKTITINSLGLYTASEGKRVPVPCTMSPMLDAMGSALVSPGSVQVTLGLDPATVTPTQQIYMLLEYQFTVSG